jgi:hypothetical protein
MRKKSAEMPRSSSHEFNGPQTGSPSFSFDPQDVTNLFSGSQGVGLLQASLAMKASIKDFGDFQQTSQPSS